MYILINITIIGTTMNNPYKKKVTVSFDVTALIAKEAIDEFFDESDEFLSMTVDSADLILYNRMADTVRSNDKEALMELLVKEIIKDQIDNSLSQQSDDRVSFKQSPLKFTFNK